MTLSRAARRKLGNLAGYADEIVRDLILRRGGTASNVRQAGHWVDRRLGETAEAAVQGDQSAESAIKIVKQARRLGDAH